jgi:hypothetical protein
VSREKERFTIGDEPILLCHTTHHRTPFITNVGTTTVTLDIQKWPMTHGLTLAPGVTVSFTNPMPAPTDVTPIFAVSPDGKGAVEYLFFR